MTYSRVEDIRREFKSILEVGNVITTEKIIEFQLQMFAMINSIVGVRYTIPITGTQPVDQQDTITFIAAAGAGEVKTIKTEGNGAETSYSYTTLGADSPTVQRDALLALIVADKNRIVEAVAVGTDKIVLTSKIFGFAYVLTLSDTGATMTSVNDTAAVFGSMGLRVLRKLEGELTACKIAGILKLKVAEKLKDSGVRQDIKEGTCFEALMKQLRDIADGVVNLDDADQETSGTGLESHNQATGFEGEFKIQTRQW